MRRRKFVRTVLATAMVVGLLGTFAPTASADTLAGVVVYTADAQVGPDSGDNDGEGLCAPGLIASGNACVPNTGVATVPDNSYDFDVPGPPPGGVGNAACIAAGVQGSGPLQSTGCSIDVSGTVTSPAGLPTPGPTCASSSSNDGSGSAVIGGTTYDVSFGWVASAGGTILVSGTLTDPNGHVHNFVAPTQVVTVTGLDPVNGAIPCVTTPATQFATVGVAAIAPA